MRVRNLISWAGHDFSYVPGEEIDLPDDVAAARIAEGLAEPCDEPEAPRRGPGRPRKAEG